MNPCFIHCHIPCEKIFEQSFLMLKRSCRMVNRLPSDIFKVSAASCNFNLRSDKTILWTFFMFSGTTAEFGRPERSASSVFVRSRLKSANHFSTICLNGEESG